MDTATAVGDLDSITIKCRFRHQTPNGKEITDPFKITVV